MPPALFERRYVVPQPKPAPTRHVFDESLWIQSDLSKLCHTGAPQLVNEDEMYKVPSADLYGRVAGSSLPLKGDDQGVERLELAVQLDKIFHVLRRDNRHPQLKLTREREHTRQRDARAVGRHACHRSMHNFDGGLGCSCKRLARGSANGLRQRWRHETRLAS